MAEQGFISKTMQKLSHDAAQFGLALGKFTARKTADTVTVSRLGAATTMTSLLAHGPGIAASLIIDGYINYRDYKFEEGRQRNFYETEIAAKLGKRPESVTVEDMKEVAQTNPVIAEGIERNKKNFRVNFGVSGLSSIAAIAAAVTVIGLLPVSGLLASFAVGMAIGLPVFIGAEKVLDKVGKKVFGLSEPSMNDVGRQPGLQHKLSVPGQIEYLEHQQDRRRTISQEQLLTLFAAARPELAGQIESRYGSKLENLSPEQKALAVKEMGPRYHLEKVAENLNNRLVRAQELAFIAHDQASGVALLETPHLSRMETLHAQMQQKIDALGAQLKEHAASMTDKVKTKLGFKRAEVSGAVLGADTPAAGTEPAKQWTATVPQPAAPGMSMADQMLARRAQQGSPVLGAV